MKLAKKVLVLSLVLFAALSVVSCSKEGEGAAGAEAPSNVHAMVFKSTGNPYGERMMSGFEEGIQEQGGTVILRAPDQPTAEAQIQVIEQLIAQKVASICVAANDFDALQPVLTRAMEAGIKITSADSAVNPASRNVHIEQADPTAIGQTLVEAAFELSGGSGEFAILSATSQASNQNAWIAVMEETLKDPKYANLNLVKIAYGDDLRDKSTSETEALLLSYPNLKVIVAPTTVGIAAAAKVVSDQGSAVKVTGLGLPSEMADYITGGACPYMYLWNPIDVGYLAAYAGTALAAGTIDGSVGGSFSAGRLGNYSITAAGGGGTQALLGPPFRFEPSNINDWKSVY